MQLQPAWFLPGGSGREALDVEAAQFVRSGGVRKASTGRHDDEHLETPRAER